jgi:hypothetical protein
MVGTDIPGATIPGACVCARDDAHRLHIQDDSLSVLVCKYVQYSIY